MIACDAGDIVVVPFPFADLRTTKRRPALVLAQTTSAAMPKLVVVAMITSQLATEPLMGDCLLSKWKEAGLLHPSKARLAKVVSLDEHLLLKKLGSLHDSDRKRVRQGLRRLFVAWL